VQLHDLPAAAAQAAIGRAVDDAEMVNAVAPALATAFASGVRWSPGWPIELGRLIDAPC
jgi:hypothetical protein